MKVLSPQIFTDEHGFKKDPVLYILASGSQMSVLDSSWMDVFNFWHHNSLHLCVLCERGALRDY